MTQNTKIEWADHTFNPWWGCTKISPACDRCYAASLDKRTGGDHWGTNQPRKRTSAKNWLEPVKWNKQADAFFAEHGRRQRVFCASMADVFDNEVDPQWRDELFGLIVATPHLDWLLLTKRIGNASKMLQNVSQCHGALMSSFDRYAPPSNIWLGATICNQEEADRDIPKLLAVPAAKRFLSIEPMLGAIDLSNLNEDREINEINALTPWKWEQELDAWRGTSDAWEADFEDHYEEKASEVSGDMHPKLDWVICGGESGPGARPMHPDWARSLRDQCDRAQVPFLFKQWGEWVPRSACYHTFEDGKSCADIDPGNSRWPSAKLTEYGNDGGDLAHSGEGEMAYMSKVGKKTAGRLLDGMEHNGVPA